MGKIIKKGLEVIKHADKSITYKPYAILEGGWISNKIYVKNYKDLYFLDENGFVEKNSEKDAITVLNEAIGRYEKEERRKIDSKVISVTDKEIK